VSKTNRTIKDFEEAVIKKKITEWFIRNCLLCEYPLRFVFSIKGENVSVGFDAGCDCVRQRGPIHKRRMKSVKYQYDLQSNRKVIDEYDQFWGFNGVSDD